MNFIKKLYKRTDWYPVYNFQDDGGHARSNILFAVIAQAVVGGFSAGIFYTGLLVGYGINIVNIGIISIIPSLANVCAIFSPFILERFKKLRPILTITRIIYYVFNILGITLLPELIKDENLRLAGLIVIVLVTNVINALFSSGYTTMHMGYITPDVRMKYFSTTSLVSTLVTYLVLILASFVTDSLEGQAQLNVIIILRYVAFAAALLDVYFLQKPKEPEYKKSGEKPKLINVFKLPFSNKKFILTMLIYGIYCYQANVPAAVTNTWWLESVNISYLYINVINFLYTFFIIFTTKYYSRMIARMGTFPMLALVLVLHVPTHIAHAFVTQNNYMWLLTAVRLSQHLLGVGLNFSVSNLMYINMPEADRTNYISFYVLVGNAFAFLGLTTGTSIVAAMGESAINVFGFALTSVPVTLILQSVLCILLPLLTLAILKYVKPEKEK
ncbi:MAG: hypothetical protein E7564_05550 [Ruminococcaceae bacterium]|nr:hypothetical protein [Oscillospiraceae bacterium]